VQWNSKGKDYAKDKIETGQIRMVKKKWEDSDRYTIGIVMIIL
jgi:hypothetical protein